jgi:hypothetical protein
MSFSEHIVYVDESGDHSLDLRDSSFPVFTLLCCVFRKDQYAAEVVPSLQRFKFRWFGHDSVILHGADVRKQRPPFGLLRQADVREPFMRELSEIIDSVPVTVVAAVINKAKHVRQYVNPANPYEIALLFCSERIYGFLRDRRDQQDVTHCIFEKRGKKEDAALKQVFDGIVAGDNHWGRLPFQAIFADKVCNSSGLQLADLMAHPVSRKVLDPSRPNRAYDVVRSKLRKSWSGKVLGYGLKVFP